MRESQVSFTQKSQLKQWLERSRQHTLSLFASLDRQTFCYQAHNEFSPVGWHLGHIGYTEALWLLPKNTRLALMEPSYNRIFAADGLPKLERGNLPDFEEICAYLSTIRSQVLDYLDRLDPDAQIAQERLWRWLIQHESQHCETVSLVLQLQSSNDLDKTERSLLAAEVLANPGMVRVPAGYFEQGDNSINSLDNERSAHQVYLDSYWIDRYPVTCAQYQKFIEANGYDEKRWWSEAGWQWLQSMPSLDRPLYWFTPESTPNYPVCGVSWYEADAYAKFVGKRLPTEAEWEKAASWNPSLNQRQTYNWGEQFNCNCNHIYGRTTPVDYFPQGQSCYGCYDMLGNVWEWTASLFQPYPNFVGFPYAGYSSSYFDREHFVLRGGSWATSAFALRPSFRNWYHPHIRQIFAGFRCAAS